MSDNEPIATEAESQAYWKSLHSTYKSYPPKQKHRLKRILTIAWLFILGGIAIYLLRNQQEDLKQVLHLLKTADRKWLLLMLVAEIAANLTVAATYVVTFRRLGHRVSIWYQAIVHLERAGVAFAAPLGGAVTAWVYVDRMKRKNIPAQDSLVALGLRTASVYGASVVILVIAAFLTGETLLIAGALAFVVVIIVAGFLTRNSGSGDWKTLQRWARRLPAGWSIRALEGIERLKSHQLTPLDLLNTVLTTLLTRVATLALIYCSVRALGYSPSFTAIFGAYVASFVAARIVPVAYGLGAVEGSMTLALTRYGIPAEIALGSTLLFRFYDFFAPSILGLVLYTIDEHRTPTKSIVVKDEVTGEIVVVDNTDPVHPNVSVS